MSVSINGANIILGVVGVAVAAMSFMCVLGFCRRAFVSHKIVIDKAAVTCSKKMFREVTLWCEPLPAYTGIRIFEQRGDQVLKTIFLCHASKNRTVPLFTCIDEQKALIVLQQAQAALNVPILPSVAI